MAVTKLWTIKDSLKRVVQYAENPEKTKFSGLAEVLHYADQKQKTWVQDEKIYLVSGIKCHPETAAKDMISVQERFGKLDKTVAMHGYQSFRPGEVTPEQCHKIGVELARKLWGNRYQVMVATHMNTDCCHNHFVINSVSFVDGKKFPQKKKQYYEMRDYSDELCKNYGLSVIQNPGGKTPRQIYFAEKRGEPTRYNLMRQAMDDAIAKSFSLEDFVKHLKKNGYILEAHPSRKYVTIHAVGDTRKTRIYHLGEGYSTKESIMARIEQNTIFQVQDQFRKQKRHPLTRFSVALVLGIDRKVGALHRLYLHYCFLLGILPKGNKEKPLSPQMREEVRKLDKIILQMGLIANNRIETMEDLQCFISDKTEKLEGLESQRQKLRNKLRRERNPENITQIKEEISLLTKAMQPVRKEIKIGKEVEKNTEKATEMIRLEETYRDTMRKRREKLRG